MNGKGSVSLSGQFRLFTDKIDCKRESLGGLKFDSMRAAPWSRGAGAAKARDERSAKISKREEMRSATGRAWKSWAL